MEIPARIEQAVSDAVAHHLETELGGRGLLLTADGLATAEAEAAQRGARLLTTEVVNAADGWPVSGGAIEEWWSTRLSGSTCDSGGGCRKGRPAGRRQAVGPLELARHVALVREARVGGGLCER
jgi:hypothetical protein